MKGKIQRASVTQADLHCEGAISIDRALLDTAGFFINERFEIYNIETGARFATYVIEAHNRPEWCGRETCHDWR